MSTDTMGPHGYREEARRILAEGGAGLREVRAAVLASFTAEWLEPYLVVEGARRGLLVRVWFGPYGQLEQEALAAEGEMYRGAPDVIVAATRMEDWGGAVERVARLARAVRERSKAAVVVWNWSGPARRVARANETLAEECGKLPGCYVFDCAGVAEQVGLKRWRDRRLELMARIPFSAEGQAAIGAHLARMLRAIFTPARKCLVLDLDGTLWGGVLGEAGWSGIELGEDYPGNAYKAFQRAARALRERGVLLAIASKNNPEDVREAFKRNRDMVLRWGDFAAAEIHWGDKAESLRRIAGRLGLGLDALAFADDSPVEREWVRGQLPEVAVLELGEDLAGRVDLLEGCELFDQMTVSAEDRGRAEFYAREREREELRRQAPSLEEFLRGLEIEAAIGEVDAGSAARVAQLLAKTNQFNLTLRRTGEGELCRGGRVECAARVRDRFGDYGLVGAALAEEGREGEWRIVEFAVSCRALGRGVEAALLAGLSRLVLARGGRRLIGEYRPGPRNQVAAGFYAGQGFEAAGENRWVRELGGRALEPPCYLRMRIECRQG